MNTTSHTKAKALIHKPDKLKRTLIKRLYKRATYGLLPHTSTIDRNIQDNDTQKYQTKV